MLILDSWIEEALALKLGESLFLPCDSKDEQKSLYIELRKLVREKDPIDPIAVARISLQKVFRDGKRWIIIRKKVQNPMQAYRKTAGGKIDRVSLQRDLRRRRKIQLLAREGYTVAQANEVLVPPLSEKEIQTIPFKEKEDA
jgi:hypothetical protein